MLLTLSCVEEEEEEVPNKKANYVKLKKKFVEFCLLSLNCFIRMSTISPSYSLNAIFPCNNLNFASNLVLVLLFF